MKNSYFKFVSGAALAVAFSLASCHSVYDVTKVEGRMQPIDSVYDVNPDAEAVALLSPYKAKIVNIIMAIVGSVKRMSLLYEKWSDNLMFIWSG